MCIDQFMKYACHCGDGTWALKWGYASSRWFVDRNLLKYLALESLQLDGLTLKSTTIIWNELWNFLHISQRSP